MESLLANPRLSRFDPLERILCYDDFDAGLNGWTGLIGNYEDSLDAMLPDYQDLRPPMLSNLTMWDTGTAGSMEGTYALKLATRPQAGGLSVGIKRHTFRALGQVQLECYFAFKPRSIRTQARRNGCPRLGRALRRAGRQPPRAALDAPLALPQRPRAASGKDAGRPSLPLGRYKPIGGSGKTVSHFHLGPEGWEDVPGEPQLLCYNEIATKMNWHYLRVGLDLKRRAFTGFQCNDHTFGPEGMHCIELPAMANLWCMLNAAFWVEADADKRAFLYIDSVLLSGEFD